MRCFCKFFCAFSCDFCVFFCCFFWFFWYAFIDFVGLYLGVFCDVFALLWANPETCNPKPRTNNDTNAVFLIIVTSNARVFVQREPLIFKNCSNIWIEH